MNLPKDVYEYLTNFADDRTILNMLSTNKDFRDEQFFKRVMERKYPLLLEFRYRYNSWKDMFIKMSYYIAKLKEKFDIPYIPTIGYDPEWFYKRYNWNSYIQGHALEIFAKGGNKDLLKLFPKKLLNTWGNFGLYGAAEGGHIDLVKFFISIGANDFKDALENAKKGGNKEIIELLQQKIDPIFYNAEYQNPIFYNAEYQNPVFHINADYDGDAGFFN